MKVLTLWQPWASLVALGVCTVPGCTTPAKKRGWCSKHYQRWWKHGDPLASGKTPPGEQMALLRHWVTTRDRAECWPWPFSTRKGYGIIYDPRTRMKAKVHRLAVEIDSGQPLQHFGCHTCDNPPCCNPSHVFDGTQVENMADAAAKGRLVPPPNRWAK